MPIETKETRKPIVKLIKESHLPPDRAYFYHLLAKEALRHIKDGKRVVIGVEAFDKTRRDTEPAFKLSEAHKQLSKGEDPLLVLERAINNPEILLPEKEVEVPDVEFEGHIPYYIIAGGYLHLLKALEERGYLKIHREDPELVKAHIEVIERLLNGKVTSQKEFEELKKKNFELTRKRTLEFLKKIFKEKADVYLVVMGSKHFPTEEEIAYEPSLKKLKEEVETLVRKLGTEPQYV